MGHMTTCVSGHAHRRFCRVKEGPSLAEAEEVVVAARTRGVVPNSATYHRLVAIQMRHELMGAH